MRLDFIAIWLEALSNTFRNKGQLPITEGRCLNCQEPIEGEHTYCPSCGQKLRYSYITIWSLFSEFFSSFLDLDNRVFRSIKMLPVPGYLAKEYMEGRRKSYLNPIRFFFFFLVVLFSVVSFTTDFTGLDSFSEGNTKTIAKSEIKDDFQHWRDSLTVSDTNPELLDSLESALFKDVKALGEDTTDFDLQFLGVDFHDKPFLRKDIYEMPVDTLLEHYQIEKFWERLVVSQFARTIRNPGGAVQFFIGNMLWGIISTIFILSLLMKLLYIRRKHFYVEHAILLFTVHTFAFVIMTIAGLIMSRTNEGAGGAVALVTFLTVLVYVYASFKRYYQQGYIKTFIKFLLAIVSYFFIIIFMIGFVLVASVLLFK